MVSKFAMTREEEYPPERCLQDVLNDLATGDHVVVVICKADDSILAYDVRWSGGTKYLQIGQAAEAITEAVGCAEL